MPYRYSGLPPYVDAAADKLGFADAAGRSRAARGSHADAVARALSQLGRLIEDEVARKVPAGSSAGLLANAKATRDGLAVQLAAVDAAIADAEKAVQADLSAVTEPAKPAAPATPKAPEPAKPAPPAAPAAKPTPPAAPAKPTPDASKPA